MDLSANTLCNAFVAVRGDFLTIVEESRLLLDLSRDVTGSLDLQAVLDKSLGALRKLIDFGGGAIQLIDGDALVAAATDPPASEDAKNLRIPVGRGVSGTIAKTCEPIYIPDIAVDPRVHWRGRTEGVSGGVRSYFGAPLIMSGAAIGVVQIDAPRVDAFTQESRALVLAFLPTIAAAVQNAQTYEREQRTVAELREAERLHADFLAVVSHELRTPLTSLSGFASLLAERVDSLDRNLIAESGQRIYRAGQRLERLIADILDLSRIEHGVLRTTISPVTCEPLLREVAADVQKTHEVRFDVPAYIPLVLADADRLRQVFANLLGNAAKFSPAGSTIEVAVRPTPDTVEVSILDHGKGIPADKLEKIFTRFFQVEPATTRQQGGLGIGLYLVKQLCDRIGATVRVQSVCDEGSTFTVSLRRAPRAERASER
jgi:signal transduction histidine kinase